MDKLTNKSNRQSDQTIDKLPFFLNKSGSPKSWFQLLETKFDFNTLSSPNKFYQTISCLPEPVLKLLSDDLVEASLSLNPYNSLKDLLIGHYRSKPADIIRSYFQSHPIAEHEKPSEYLSKCARDLESIEPGITKDNEQIVRTFFLSSLSPDVQKIVNGVTNIDLGMLAEFADRMSHKSIDNRLTNGSTASAAAPSPNDADQLTIAALTQEILTMKSEIATLKSKLEKLKDKFQSGSIVHSKSSSSIAPNSSAVAKIEPDSGASGDKSKKKTNFCFYHLKYGSGAQKCQLGCLYQPKSMDLKVSSICVHHARFGSDSSQCLAGCAHYSHFNRHSLR